MGEEQNQPFQPLFNASLKVDFQGSRVTSDGGLILVREFDERLGLEKLMLAEGHLHQRLFWRDAAGDLGAAGAERLVSRNRRK